MWSELNCTRCELCASAAGIFDNGTPMHFALLFQLIVTPGTLLAAVLILLSVYFAKTIHFNLRTLLISYLTFVIVANIGVLLSAIYQSYAGYIVSPDFRCDWQIFKVDSALSLKNLYIIGVLGTAITTILVAIERSAAAVFYRSYSKNRKPALLVMLLIAHIIVSLSILMYDVKGRNQIFPYAAVELYDGQKADEFLKFLFGTNIFGGFIFLMLSQLNTYRLTAMATATGSTKNSRDQLEEIMLATRTLAPIVLINVALLFSAMLIFHFSLPFYDKSLIIDKGVLKVIENYAPWAELQICLLPFATIFIVILLPVFNDEIKSSLYRISGLYRWFGSTDTRTTNVLSSIEIQWREVLKQNEGVRPPHN